MAVTEADIDRVTAEIQAERDSLNAAPDGDPTTNAGVVREARSLPQDLFAQILRAPDLGPQARAAVETARDKLCGPDQQREGRPAEYSYAKRIHMAVQQFGAHSIQAVNRLKGDL